MTQPVKQQPARIDHECGIGLDDVEFLARHVINTTTAALENRRLVKTANVRVIEAERRRAEGVLARVANNTPLIVGFDWGDGLLAAPNDVRRMVHLAFRLDEVKRACQDDPFAFGEAAAELADAGSCEELAAIAERYTTE